MTDWSDLVARARGLSTHLADTRREQADRLARLARWAGPRRRALTVLFEDEDRRSIRALLRGAVANVPPSIRLAGLLPSPTLPRAVLDDLAVQPSAAAVVEMLVLHGNPYGASLFPEARREQPHLLALEARLDATFAARASAGARQADRQLREHVRLTIDVQNSWSAIIGHGDETAAALTRTLFLRGGMRVDRPMFDRAANAASRADACAILAPRFARTALGAALRDGISPAALDDAALRTAHGLARAAARVAPLSTASITWYVLGQQLSVRAAQRRTYA